MTKIILAFLLIFSSSTVFTQGKFLLLMGPSGTGKSTIIKHLKNMDSRFEYVTPCTTRELRPGEQDKIHVSLDEITELQEAGKLLTVNVIYGIHYATPKYIIDDALSQNKFPVLDWPIDKLELMEKTYTHHVFKVYIEPDNLQELGRRLALDNRDKDGKRYQAGVQEIENLISGAYDKHVHLRIVNKKNHDLEVAKIIYQQFLQSLQ